MAGLSGHFFVTLGDEKIFTVKKRVNSEHWKGIQVAAKEAYFLNSRTKTNGIKAV